MQNITTKQFQILTDIDLVWNFMAEINTPDCANGLPAPFFEYALTSTWFDKSLLYLNRLWLDGETVVAFVYYEDPITNIFFNLRPGYEFLAEEMLQYAQWNMPGHEADQTLVLFPGQTALIRTVQNLGYSLAGESTNMVLDFDRHILNFDLPEGFHFVDPGQVDPVKLARCTWKGFDHEDKGPFENWLAPDPGTPWNPQKAYQGTAGPLLAPPPHSTYQHNCIIADDTGEYACFSGMWWVPGNALAYMEPLCTVPEHRGKGLAAAALTRHCRSLIPLGAKYMTGGGHPFYRRIGYNRKVRWLYWKR